jgi:hypothetical protein
VGERGGSLAAGRSARGIDVAKVFLFLDYIGCHLGFWWWVIVSLKISSGLPVNVWEFLTAWEVRSKFIMLIRTQNPLFEFGSAGCTLR